MEWSTLIVAVCFVGMAGIIRGFAGFGAALAMVPPLSGLFGPSMAVAMVTIIETIGMLQLLPNAFKNADWQYVLPLSLTSVLTVPFGVYLLVLINPDTIKLLMGTIVICFVLAMAFGWQRNAQFRLSSVVGIGTLSGFLAGSTGMAGPPVILFLLSPKESPSSRIRASLIIFFGITGFVTLVSVLFLSDIILYELLFPLMFMIPVFMLTTHMGAHLFSRTTSQSYKNLALILLGIISTFSLIGLYGS